MLHLLHQLTRESNRKKPIKTKNRQAGTNVKSCLKKCLTTVALPKAIKYVLLSISWMQEPERCAGDVGANEHLLPKWLFTVGILGLSMQTSLNPIFWNHTWWLYIKMKLKKAEKTGRPGVAMWPGQSLERPAAASTRPHFPIRGQPACSLCRLPPRHHTPTAWLPAGP